MTKCFFFFCGQQWKIVLEPFLYSESILECQNSPWLEGGVWESIYLISFRISFTYIFRFCTVYQSYFQALASVLQPTASNCCCFDTVHIDFGLPTPSPLSTKAQIAWFDEGSLHLTLSIFHSDSSFRSDNSSNTLFASCSFGIGRTWQLLNLLVVWWREDVRSCHGDFWQILAG